MAAQPNPLLDFGASSNNSSDGSAAHWPYTAAHESFRLQARAFVQQHLTPAVVARCEELGRAPPELLRASYAAGLYSFRAPVELGGTPPSRGKSSSSDASPAGPATSASEAEFDLLFDVVLVQELARCGAMGLVTELMGSFGMVLPLLQAFAPKEMKDAVLPGMVRAETHVCFAVTEPPPPPPPPAAPTASASKRETAVGGKPARTQSPAPRRRGLRTTARWSADGSSLEVTGEKMYISFGLRADYILTAVQLLRAQGTGADEDEDAASPPALSLLLIPRHSAGVHVENLPLSGWRSTSTTRIRFERVHVPASALVVDGSRAQGAEVPSRLARLLRANVTRERFITGVLAAASARVCLDDALSFARGKVLSVDPRSGRRRLLIHSDAVREQLVSLAARVAQAEALVEKVAVQLSAPNMRESFVRAGDEGAAESAQAAAARRQRALQCALLKHACSEVLSVAVLSASSVLGAAALATASEGYSGGPGARVERIRRDAPVNAAAGGGEHTLLAFVAKQAKL